MGLAIGQAGTFMHPWLVGSNAIKVVRVERRLCRVIDGYQLYVPSTVLGRSILITIGDGFECDGFSLPWPLWVWTHPFDEVYLSMALTHDWGYAINTPEMPRRDWDVIFYAEGRVLQMRWTKAQSKYYGVRAFGWPAWARHRAA